MGSDAWGAEEDWGGDVSWGGDSWGGQTSYEGTGYLRSLAVLAEAPPIAIHNSFNILDDDDTFSVPIADLVVMSKRKLSNKFKNKKRFDTRSSLCSSSLCSSSCCSASSSTAVGPGRRPPTPLKMGGDPKPTSGHEFDVNRDPNMATAWTRHKAIVNYENFHGICRLELQAHRR